MDIRSKSKIERFETGILQDRHEIFLLGSEKKRVGEKDKIKKRDDELGKEKRHQESNVEVEEIERAKKETNRNDETSISDQKLYKLSLESVLTILLLF